MADLPFASTSVLVYKTPAIVVTTPDETTIRRMSCWFLSATNAIAPKPSRAIPGRSSLNLASVPVPSFGPVDVVPASVFTVPEDTSMLRTAVPSATTASVPSEFIAIADGSKNAALMPVPSTRPEESLPARVDTALEEIMILRTR